MPTLEREFWLPLKDRGLSVLAIGDGHTLEELKPFKDKYGLSFPVAVDPKKELASRYGVSSIPGNYLINKEGKVLFAEAGFGAETAEELKGMICKELGIESNTITYTEPPQNQTPQSQAQGVPDNKNANQTKVVSNQGTNITTSNQVKSLKSPDNFGYPMVQSRSSNPLQQVIIDMGQGKYEQVLAKLKIITASMPDNAQAHYLLAVVYVRLKQFKLAEAEYSLAIKYARDEKTRSMAQLGLNKLKAN